MSTPSIKSPAVYVIAGPNGAGKLLLKRIRQLAAAGENFSFETTLAGKGHARLLQGLKDRGYTVHLFFLWLPTDDLAVQRVANRVSQGGHHIPEPVIRRRCRSGLRNLAQLYRPIADSFWLCNGASMSPMLVAVEEASQTEILNSQRYSEIFPQAGER